MALYEFYGKECPHCVRMMPLVDKLKAEGVLIETFETWHDASNERKRKQQDKGVCGGVPFFINTESGEWICGGTDEKTLRRWAAGKRIK